MNTVWSAPYWVETLDSIDWKNPEMRVEILAKILERQRGITPKYSVEQEATSVEIISDGIYANEPSWHGLDRKRRVFETEDYEDLKRRVSKRRSRIGTEMKTHFGIANLFYRPVLINVFSAIGKRVECSIYTGRAWEHLDHSTTLPLKVDRKQGASASGEEIAAALRMLHTEVLWPAFFTDQNQDMDKQSLVLLHASSFKVLGVWALHVQGRNLDSHTKMDPFDLLEIAFHPMTIINDVFGGVVSTHGAA